MDFVSLFTAFLGMIAAIPAVGGFLAKLVAIVVPVSAVVTAIVAIWHALVVSFAGLAKVPGLEKLQGLANFFSTNEEKIGGFIHTYVLPILNRLSMLPLPKEEPKEEEKK